jgi:hypothetical protein
VILVLILIGLLLSLDRAPKYIILADRYSNNLQMLLLDANAMNRTEIKKQLFIIENYLYNRNDSFRYDLGLDYNGLTSEATKLMVAIAIVSCRKDVNHISLPILKELFSQICKEIKKVSPKSDNFTENNWYVSTNNLVIHTIWAIAMIEGKESVKYIQQTLIEHDLNELPIGKYLSSISNTLLFSHYTENIVTILPIKSVFFDQCWVSRFSNAIRHYGIKYEITDKKKGVEYLYKDARVIKEYNKNLTKRELFEIGWILVSINMIYETNDKESIILPYPIGLCNSPYEKVF